MSFMIKLGTFNNERNALEKTVQWGFEHEGVLKEGTSIVDPVIIIDATMVAVHDFNYMRIYTFGRYYFITDIVSIRSNLIEIHAHCDVLYSFADEIGKLEGIYERREKGWNLLINDGSIKTYQNSIVINWPVLASGQTGFDRTNGSYVLALAGS